MRVRKVLHRMVNIGRVYGETFFDDPVEFVDYPACILNVLFVAHDGKVIPPDACSDVKIFLDVFYIFVARAKKVSCYVDIIEG